MNASARPCRNEFVKFRELLSTHRNLEKKIIELEKRSDERFEIVFQTLDQLLSIEKSPNKKIGFTAKEKQTRFSKKQRQLKKSK